MTVWASDSEVFNVANKIGFWESFDQISAHNPKLVDNLEYHYMAMRQEENTGDTDYATMAQRLFGFNPGSTVEDVLKAVVGTAFEMIDNGFPAK